MTTLASAAVAAALIAAQGGGHGHGGGGHLPVPVAPAVVAPVAAPVGGGDGSGDADHATRDAIRAATKASQDAAKAAAKASQDAAKAAAKASQDAAKARRDAAKAGPEVEHTVAHPASLPPLPSAVTQAAGTVAAAAAPVVAAATAVAPAPPSPATPAATNPPPAAVAAPTPVPHRAGSGRAPARRHVSRHGARGTRRVSPARGATRRSPVVSPAAAPHPAPARTPRHAPAAQAPVKRPAHVDKPSALTRTVVRVLHVIPAELRLLLAVLAALGLALAAAASAQTRRAHRLERQRRLLTADVGLLQSALLPVLAPRIGDARVSAAYRPAEGLAAGGDFYDAFVLADGRTAVVVGDVAGHGRDVVPVTALVRYSVRAYLDAGLAPRNALQVAAAALEAQLAGRLVTVVVGVLDSRAGTLTYACAGHPAPLIAGAEDRTITCCSSPPLGAGLATGRRQTTIVLPADAVACFTTDGLMDARVGAGRLEREGLARQLGALTPGAAASDLLARIVRNSDSQPDDMAVCLLSPATARATTAGTHRRSRWVGVPFVASEELELDAAAVANGQAARFLEACGIRPQPAAEALARAGDAIARGGIAVLVVRRGERAARVEVGPRPALTLVG